ncbi:MULTISPECIES: dihydroneopterin aldolase [Collinsella]|uniref:dihydroneopterin aldolase n=1 Tax=Collinsella TaxID=102106 RepID=UPI000B3976D9|nr:MULTISPECIES: dihydroneopterin aldolase [Collinsella]MBM6907243.1 dihydroneopterin aldolase [Collinsella intestinalis]OUO64470.1 dihydroneopterin aldolase [Collinsella sp. An268]
MTDKHLPEDTSRGEETTLAQRDRAGLPVARRELAKLDPAALEHADKILIEGLEVFANHGVYPAENELGQKFVVSATLYTSLAHAGTTDDLDASINYGEVCHTIDAYLRAHTFKLIEAAAEATAERLLADYPALIAVRLRIAKPWAPIGLPLSSVAVEIERTR